MAGVHSRARSFDAAAGAYERGRPGWPPEAVERAAERLSLGRDATVLDLGAGTGKLTRELTGRFASVTAVEPLGGMRAVLERTAPAARALAGTAEAIPLPDGAVDAVFVAEAFHWFDAPAAVTEIARVLRPGGGVAVLYNQLDWDDADAAWRAETSRVFHRHRLPADEVDPYDQTAWRRALEAIGPVHDDVVEGSAQRLDAAGLEAMYASFSGLAGLPPDRRDAALAEIRAVLARKEVGEVELRYRTELTTARR